MVDFITSHLKKRILVQDQGGREFQTRRRSRGCEARIQLYFEDLKFTPNADIGLKDFFETACTRTKPLFITILYIVLLLGMSGCPAEEEPERWIIEIEDNRQDEFSARLLKVVQQELDGKIYTLTKDHEIVLKENDKSQDKPIRKDFPSHQFISNPDVQPGNGDGIIYMRLNPPDAGGLYHADFLRYLYRKDGTRKRLANPGNFKFEKRLTETELQQMIIELLVGLTFK